ncbi:MAG TPA: SDR family oxidoreductase [Gemmatimonadaceae bacterium]|nr:SDR family oxidoreductase [Gemmatimonadaceae bacterium]
MKIIVTAGTGLIGSKIVTRLRALGHDVVAASRSSGVDTMTGSGLADVLAKASVVIDVSNPPTFDVADALEFFETSTRNLLSAESTAGVGHHVALSVVGADRLSESGYMRAKLEQEKLIEENSIPYSIVRATQFFESIEKLAGLATDGKTVRVPPVLVQPIAGDDVASALCEVSVGAPLNGTIEVAGPEQLRAEELTRRRLLARHDSRAVVSDPDARFFGARVEERSLLPGPGARLSATRFEDWLARSAERAYATLHPRDDGGGMRQTEYPGGW